MSEFYQHCLLTGYSNILFLFINGNHIVQLKQPTFVNSDLYGINSINTPSYIQIQNTNTNNFILHRIKNNKNIRYKLFFDGTHSFTGPLHNTSIQMTQTN